MFEHHFALFIFVVTTTAAYFVGRRLFGAPNSALKGAIRTLMECIGAFVVFLSANVVLGVAVIFLIRSITPRFVSVYVLIEDRTLVILSAVQGILFRLWRTD